MTKQVKSFILWLGINLLFLIIMYWAQVANTFKALAYILAFAVLMAGYLLLMMFVLDFLQKLLHSLIALAAAVMASIIFGIAYKQGPSSLLFALFWISLLNAVVFFRCLFAFLPSKED